MRNIGIDLGTTNSAIAEDGKALPLAATRARGAVMPSVVAYPPSGVVLVGVPAKRRRAIDPPNTLASFKRVLGARLDDPITKEFGQHYAYRLVAAADGSAAFDTRAGAQPATAVASAVLGALIEDAGLSPGECRAVLTVPTGLPETRRQATLAAARQAGLAEVTLLAEPIATATAYQASLTGHYAAVFDLGGGTFNFALIDCSAKPFSVLGHDANLYLGGDDIDLALAKWAARELLERHGWDVQTDPIVFDRLAIECERAKVRLSFATQTKIELSEVDPMAPAAATGLALSRGHLGQLTSDLVRRAFIVCDQVLGAAGVRPDQVDQVLMAGGSALAPMIRSGVEAYFGRQPRCEHHPMEVVAIGASLSSTAREPLL